MGEFKLNRIPPEQIKEVIEWCEKRKMEEMRVPLIELNPFKHFDWLRNKTVIQIDKEKEIADKNGIVYDSSTRSLYEYVNGVWKKIE
jgi:hypothetical protein